MLERPSCENDTVDMPRYFFDVDDGASFSRDKQGLELGSTDEAQHEAVKALPGIARDALPDGTRREFAVLVRDENEQPILIAKLSLAVESLIGVYPPLT
jgi:hypothetical protein